MTGPIPVDLVHLQEAPITATTVAAQAEVRITITTATIETTIIGATTAIIITGATTTIATNNNHNLQEVLTTTMVEEAIPVHPEAMEAEEVVPHIVEDKIRN